MKQFITIIIAACLLWIPVNSFAKVSTKISPELRYMNGNGKYHIDFEDTWANGGHGESELEFPVNNLMIGASLEVGSRYEKTGQNKGVFSMTLLAIPSGDAGTMKDSDWIENDAAFGETAHAGKDMYTESKVNLNGVMFDVNYAYHLRVNNSWTVGPMVGYRYQKFQYDVNGYRGIYYTTPVSGAGKSLEYENEFKMPYIGLSSGLDIMAVLRK